ncbi:MAG: ergothioneine biosynthesis protein EgtB [Bacteroidota bacterium]
MTLQFNNGTADTIKRHYSAVRNQSMHICAPLQAEDYVVQPIVDVSPPKWHLGHVSWFFENFVLIPNLEGYQAFDLRLNYFFNSYYESQGPRILRSNRGNMTRPNLDTVINYRKHIDDHMSILLDQYKKELLPKELFDLIILGLQHEQQHQELLVTDIKYILGNNPLFPVYKENEKRNASNAPTQNYLKVKEGVYEIGYQGQGFCFDNELGVHKVYLHEFEIQDRLITNGEYLEFVNAGGYQNFEYWLMEGIEWARQLETKAPNYWFEQDGQWYEFTLSGLQPLDLSAPVTHISYYEADAYARWRGLRLPTEFEWEVACHHYAPTELSDNVFLEGEQFHPIAQEKLNDYQFLGNCWEWTSSAYLPYPNYPRLKGALGEYNGKFMVNQMVLKGGSCATSKSHIRISYRNFFHADKRWQFTGIRLAK